MDAKHVGRPDQACRFCGIRNLKYAESYDAPVAESDHFFAVPSLGGFVPGWTLVCPKEHCLNLAGVYGTEEFAAFSRGVASALARSFGAPVVVFEHGCRRGGSLTGCGTDHAHLHLVPFRGSLEAAVRDFDPSGEWIAGNARDLNMLVGLNEYLIMAESFDDLYGAALVRSVDVPRSQYFRLAIAEALGLSAIADYRHYPFTELARLTASRLIALENQIEILREVA
jgi:diadenosine tetraphosphate (Ap4A) HIT family hydrolase